MDVPLRTDDTQGPGHVPFQSWPMLVAYKGISYARITTCSLIKLSHLRSCLKIKIHQLTKFQKAARRRISQVLMTILKRESTYEISKACALENFASFDDST